MTERMRNGIVKRGSTWSYVVRERDPQTGKTRARWVGGCKTRKEAEEKRDAARHAVHRGTYVAPQDLTVKAYLERWIAGHEVELKPSTARATATRSGSISCRRSGTSVCSRSRRVACQSSFARCRSVVE